MGEKTFVKASGLALTLWALHLLARDYIFAFTHGTTEAAMGATFLGIEGKQYGMVWPAFAPLGLVGFAGVFVQVSPGLSRTGKAGFWLALLGLGLWFVASVMQYWILDIDEYFHSPVIYGGWLLSLLSIPVLAAGLVLAGIEIRRANALPRGRSLVLVMGILLVPTLVATGYLVGHSDGGFASKLLYGSLSLPYDLCWLRLGQLCLTSARDQPIW